MKRSEFVIVDVVQLTPEFIESLLDRIDLLESTVDSLETEINKLKDKKTSPYLTKKEAMVYVRISSRTTFNKYIDLGLVTIFGDRGNRPLFLKSDLDNFIQGYNHLKVA